MPKTELGRVVYDRRKHEFTMKDLKRVMDAVYGKDNYLVLIRGLSNIMVRALLEQGGGITNAVVLIGIVIQDVVNAIGESVQTLMEKLIAIFNITITLEAIPETEIEEPIVEE